MSIVTGTVTIEFANGTVLGQVHTFPLDLSAADAIGTLLAVIEAVHPDVVALSALWGPLVDLTWVIDVVPAVIPLPAAGWLLGAALAALAVVRR